MRLLVTAIMSFMGVNLLMGAYLIVDIATPGRLPSDISRSMSAAVVGATRFLSVAAIIVAASIAADNNDVITQVARFAVYSAAGTAYMIIALQIIGVFIGRGADAVVNSTKPGLLPGAVLLSAGQLAGAAVVVAGLLAW